MITGVPASINNKWHIFHSDLIRLERKRQMEKTGNSRLSNNLIMLYQLYMNSRVTEGRRTIRSSGSCTDVNSGGNWFEFGPEHRHSCLRIYSFPPGKCVDKALYYAAKIFNQILFNLILSCWQHRSIYTQMWIFLSKGNSSVRYLERC
jgi:hypothetical protein